MKIRSREKLQEYINHGNVVKYLHFWGHTNRGEGIDKSCFSQWYDSPFSEDGVEFITAEHYMMAEKAKLFNDISIYQQILNADNPGAAKALGREVRGFDEDKWNRNRFDVVVRANLLKFGQNPDLRDFLINTGDSVLVEASPADRIWGIGLSSDDAGIDNPNLWKGLNLLGFALMEVRDRLTAN